jgi:hypothetical protein
MVAATTLAIATLGLGTSAFASGPPASTEIAGVTNPIGHYTPGKPFSSGQVIAVKIPPNSTFTPGAGIRILECGAPRGAIPTDPSDCDGLTIQGDTVLVNPNGSVDYTRTRTTGGFTVYALPDFHSLGESKDGQPICNTTHLCVLYVGQNQLDFRAPHFWSKPFTVSLTTDNTGANPGDGGYPAAKTGSSNGLLTVGLPILVVVVVGGVLVIVRRRRAVPSPTRS